MFDFFYSKQFLILLGTLIVFEISRFYYKYFTRPNPLPGPIPLPFVGNLFHVFYTLFKEGIYQFDFAKYTSLLAKRYGELSEVYQGSNRAILLSKAEYLENPFLPKTDTKYFHRVIVEGMKEIVGDGLFLNNDYQSWKRNRKFVTQSLMSPKFLRGFAITVQTFFERSESGWDLHEGDEIILNLSDWIRCFTTDVTISTSVGQKSYCLASTNLKKSEWTDEMKESREIFDGVELFLQSQLFFVFVPRFVRLYFPGFNYYQNLYMKNTTFLRSTILDKIEKRRREIDQMPEREMVGDDILDILLTSNTPRDPHGWKNDDVPLTDVEIRDLVLDLTIAGSDTSANLFVAVFWYINAYPEVKARFLEEIKSILGEKTTNYQISHEDLGKFKYLDAIVKETHRMRPIVPINGRELAGTDTIAGYKWDSDTIFFINSVYIQNQKDYWEDPEKFIPDRFLNEGNIVKNSYIPFGGGIRPCPGRLMAITEIKSLLILFFGRYNVDLVDKVNPLKQVYSVVNTFPNLMIKLSPKYKGKV